MTGSTTIDATDRLTGEDRCGSAYVCVGGAAVVDEVVGRFYRLVLDDGDLRGYFGVEVAELRWHQAAQLARALGGPDRYGAAGVPERYLPLLVPAELFHRSAFYLVRAVDCAGAGREAVAWVAWALSARRCRIVGGYPLPGVQTSPVLVSVEGPW